MDRAHKLGRLVLGLSLTVPLWNGLLVVGRQEIAKNWAQSFVMAAIIVGATEKAHFSGGTEVRVIDFTVIVLFPP